MYDIKIKSDMRALTRLTRLYPDISQDVREAKVTEAIMLLEAAVKKGTPWGAGPIHLRDSVHSKVSVLGSKVHGLTGTPMEHGEPVEHGTKPHFPPTGPIAFWVEKKMGLSGKDAERVAFLIARKISKKGTKGQKMFETAMTENESRVMAILAEIPGEIARRAEGMT